MPIFGLDVGPGIDIFVWDGAAFKAGEVVSRARADDFGVKVGFFGGGGLRGIGLLGGIRLLLSCRARLRPSAQEYRQMTDREEGLLPLVASTLQ